MGVLWIVTTWVLQALMISTTGAVVFYTVYIHYQHRKYAHLPGPKRRSFFFGNLGEVIENKTKGIYFLQLSAKWRKEFGSIFVVHLLHNVIVMVAEPAIVKEVAFNIENKKPETFAQSLGWIFGQRIGGRGLFTETNHEKWSMQRKLFDPAFRKKYLLGLLGIFNQCADRAVNYLSQFGDGKTEVKMADICGRVTLDTIGKSTFGMKDLNVIADPDNKLTKAISYVFKAGSLLFHNGIIAEYDPRKAMRELRNNVRDGGSLIRKIAKDAIFNRMEEMKRGEDTPNDILSFILRASESLKESLNFGLEEILDEFVTFFIAGQDTTANLLASTILCLGRYPNIMERLKQEVDEVIGDKEDITQDELNKLEYMARLFKETLRLYGPAGGIHKICAKEFIACGFRIPAKTFLMLHHQAMIADEQFFDEPDKFDPERWVKEDRRRMYAYFPFGLGPRSCIGQNFALMEAKVVLAKFIQRFDISLVPGQSFTMITEVTSKPKDGTLCYLKSRKH